MEILKVQQISKPVGTARSALIVKSSGRIHLPPLSPMYASVHLRAAPEGRVFSHMCSPEVCPEDTCWPETDFFSVFRVMWWGPGFIHSGDESLIVCVIGVCLNEKEKVSGNIFLQICSWFCVFGPCCHYVPRWVFPSIHSSSAWPGLRWERQCA